MTSDIASVEDVVAGLHRLLADFDVALAKDADGATERDREDIAAIRSAISLLSALEKDALRYRWLRDEAASVDWQTSYMGEGKAYGKPCAVRYTTYSASFGGQHLDTAIDLARGQS